MMDLQTIQGCLEGCTRCKLHSTRKNIVFGAGSPKAKVMIIGEAPGAREDTKGEPFVGASGQVLDKLLVKAGMVRQDIYLCNVLKCRPPQNRDPELDEMAACLPFLHQQIEAVRPKVIITLGLYATIRLSQHYGTMGDLAQNGQMTYQMADGTRIPIVACYHPSYLLRLASGDKVTAKPVYQGFLNGLLRAKYLAEGPARSYPVI